MYDSIELKQTAFLYTSRHMCCSYVTQYERQKMGVTSLFQLLTVTKQQIYNFLMEQSSMHMHNKPYHVHRRELRK